MTCGELAAEAPAFPDRFAAQRYECYFHGIGLEEENPSLCHPADAQPNPETVLEEGTALVVELYAGEVGRARRGEARRRGARHRRRVPGVRPYPFSDRLLA